MPLPILDPSLAAGWEPDTPLTDTLLRRFLVNFRDTIEALGIALDGITTRRDDLVAVDVGRPAFIVNTATLHAPLMTHGRKLRWTLSTASRAATAPAPPTSSAHGRRRISAPTAGSWAGIRR